MSLEERIFWLAGPALAALLLCRLFAAGLHRTYRALAIYLAASLLRTLLLMRLDVNSDAYGAAYKYTMPVLWLASLAVALEIYSMVLAQYRGLAVLSRRTLLIVMAASIALSVLSAWPELDFAHEPYAALRLTLLLDKTVAMTLFVFLVLLSMFLAWYPIPLRRNLLLYSFGFCIILLTIVSAVLLRNMGGHEWTRSASTLMLAANVSCLLAWVLFVSRKGEAEVRSSAIPRGAAEEQRLLQQLKSLNSILERGRNS